jgi:membrane-bound ClpP family serine protease
MGTFIQLEGGYLAIGIFILGVAFFVGTRPFVGNGQAWKKIVPFVSITISGFIIAHYLVTINRMADVKKRFNSGGAVICESKAVRKVAQSVIIDPKRPQGWVLIGDEFHSPHYERTFYVARCLEYYYPDELKKISTKD